MKLSHSISVTSQSAGGSASTELAEILDRYLSDLERGIAPDEQALLAAHPHLAVELRSYLENVRLLHGVTHELGRSDAGTPEGALSSTGAMARQIGDFKIVREIGRGGMGIVYEAHQISLNRQVALKILPFAAVLDQRQIARFRHEAQAAAQLHHPNIVPVFAVGQEQGVHYYAMQYVNGQSLEQVICAVRQATGQEASGTAKTANSANASTKSFASRITPISSLPANARDDFFKTVARLGREAALALHHAHQLGIVHRDIKPSNLLIDDQGKLWVTDFGLARIQTESGVTLTGDVVGTLRYMSPEQASGRAELVDVRTDVYSLGATLYELLTQRQAHTAQDRPLLMRQVANDEPIAPRRLCPKMPIELETVILTALAKAREERYRSAKALADDLERFIEGQQPSARRPSVIDRAGKWARRHRPLVTMATCAGILLSVVSAVAVLLLAREQVRTSEALAQVKSSGEKAEQNFQRAERYFQQARGAVDRLGVRMADQLRGIPGTEVARRDLLIETLGYYQTFVADAENDSQLRDDRARAHFRCGQIEEMLGTTDKAIDEYQQAEQLFEESVSLPLASTKNNLALLLASRGQLPSARAQYVAAIEIARQLTERYPKDIDSFRQLAESEGNLGMLCDQMGDATNAERLIQSAAETLRQLVTANPGDPMRGRDLAIAITNLSYVLRATDTDGACAAAREAVAILQPLVDKFPNEIQFQDDLALGYNNLAALESRRGRLDESIRWYNDAVAIQERLVRKSPGVVRYRSDLATSLNNLGVLDCQTNRTADADAAFSRAREILALLTDDFPDTPLYRDSLAALLNNQALALAGAKRFDEALKIYKISIDEQQRGNQSPRTASEREALSKTYYNFAAALQARGQLDQAADVAQRRAQLWRGDGERLVSVAAEMADLSRQMRESPDGVKYDARRQKLDEQVVDTLWQARRAGQATALNLAKDERFKFYRGNNRFRTLVSETETGQSELSSPQQLDRNSTSNAKN